MSAPNVVGLDLSITATGIATAEGCVTAGGDSKKGDFRLRIIRGGVMEMCGFVEEPECPRAELVVVEDLPTHAHGAGTTGMVHGVVRHLLLTEGVPYVLVPPATLKKYATGRENASKAEMAVALFKRFGLELADDNQVDAFWLRAAGLDALGHAPVVLPEVQRSVLGKVEWPAVEP